MQSLNKSYRLATGTLFFLQGLCFASWASRIPSIQQQLNLSDALLGMVLFALPVGSLLGLPFSGSLVTKYGSKKIAALALLFYSLLLVTIGISNNVIQLITCLVLFGMAGNISNIAINTQAVRVEEKYGRNIMASFHGLWSLAGFSAAGIGTFMLGKAVPTNQHFLFIAFIIIAGVAATFTYLVPDGKNNIVSTKFFVKPDSSLMKLGVVAFFCMMCEGAMFDWSGIYFKKVVHAEKEWVGAGYTAFMSTMAIGRFLADWIVFNAGFKKTIQISGILIATGLGIAVALPFLTSAILGFLIVGFGVSSVVPLVYSEAGRSKLVSPGIALAAVSSIGFLGFLVGPPLIGFVSGIFSLRISFLIIGFIGILIILIAGTLHQGKKMQPAITQKLP